MIGQIPAERLLQRVHYYWTKLVDSNKKGSSGHFRCALSEVSGASEPYILLPWSKWHMTYVFVCRDRPKEVTLAVKFDPKGFKRSRPW